jgi:hypothetical protein
MFIFAIRSSFIGKTIEQDCITKLIALMMMLVCSLTDSLGLCVLLKQGLQNINILSIALAFKAHHSNGILPSNINYNKYCKEINVSSQSFKKCINYCKENNLILPLGNSFQFVSISKLINHLLGKKNHNNQIRVYSVNRRGFLGYRMVIDKPTAKQIKSLLLEEIAKVNFQQQKFSIDKKQQNRRSKKFKSREIVGTIVTGKFHLSNLINCSKSTALNLLRKWNKQKLIDRKVLTIHHQNNFNNLNIQYSKRYKNFFENIGSVILNFNELGNLKYLPKENTTNTNLAIQLLKDRKKELNTISV